MSGDHTRMGDRPENQSLVCVCPSPRPEYIPLFDAWQCANCLRALSRNTHLRGSTR